MTQFYYTRRGLGYEVSTLGDKRFSAMVARMPDGRTIEQHYQCDIKGYDPGGTYWRLGKGKPPLKHYTPEELYHEYKQLWVTWGQQHEDLLDELAQLAAVHNYTLKDTFASSAINQARVLAEILNTRHIASEHVDDSKSIHNTSNTSNGV